MRMEQGFQKALARQIREGVEIEMCKGVLMNSKAEWNNARIPRIIIEEGDRQTEDKESGLCKQRKETRIPPPRVERNEKRRAEDHSDISNQSMRGGKRVRMETHERRQKMRVNNLEKKARASS